MISSHYGKFTSNSGRVIELCLPSMDKSKMLLTFINRLIEEDTFLTFHGRPKTLLEEEYWIKNALQEINNKKSFVVWAIYDNKIIGQCDFIRGVAREFHTCTIGLMIDRDFRGEGLGEFLFDLVLKKAKEFGIKIVSLQLFSDNLPAFSLYQKKGFKVWGRLPNGLYRKGKYSDLIKMYKILDTDFREIND